MSWSIPTQAQRLRPDRSSTRDTSVWTAAPARARARRALASQALQRPRPAAASSSGIEASHACPSAFAHAHFGSAGPRRLGRCANRSRSSRATRSRAWRVLDASPTPRGGCRRRPSPALNGVLTYPPPDLAPGQPTTDRRGGLVRMGRNYVDYLVDYVTRHVLNDGCDQPLGPTRIARDAPSPTP